jgi:predicted dehydrogenase
MEKIPAVIIGLGRIAGLLEDDTRREKPATHAGAIAANPGCALLAGCDMAEERRRLFADRWAVPVYEDAAEMIRAHNPKILVIATHPDSHYHYCRLAAASGVPVVICEKPLADTLSAARKIAALGTRQTTIMVNHERRYSADYLKAKEILAGEKLGAILSVRAVLCAGKNQGARKEPRLLDVFWHDGTHLADAIMFLTGLKLKHRKCRGAKLTKPEGTAWLEGELVRAGRDNSAAVPAVIEIGAGRDYLVFEIEFSCGQGRLRIGNGVFEVWESGESPYAEKFRSLKKTEETFRGPTGYFAGMIADAVACVREPGRQPVSSAADGLAVIEYLNSVKSWR